MTTMARAFYVSPHLSPSYSCSRWKSLRAAKFNVASRTFFSSSKIKDAHRSQYLSANEQKRGKQVTQNVWGKTAFALLFSYLNKDSKENSENSWIEHRNLCSLNKLSILTTLSPPPWLTACVKNTQSLLIPKGWMINVCNWNSTLCGIFHVIFFRFFSPHSQNILDSTYNDEECLWYVVKVSSRLDTIQFRCGF